MALRWWIALGFVAASVAACFSDSPPVATGPGGTAATGGTGGTAGEPVCPMGSGGCACYGNMSCDAGFVCDVPLQLCVSETCVDGQLGCLCDAGSCERGLVCEAGLCAEESSDGTTQGTTQGSEMSSTSAATTAGPDSTAGPVDTSTGDASTGPSDSTGDEDGVCFPAGIYGSCGDNPMCECVDGVGPYSACTQGCSRNEECGNAADFPGSLPGCYPISPIMNEMVCALRCQDDNECPCGLSCVDSGVPTVSICAVPDL